MNKSYLEWEYEQYQKQKKTRNQRKRSRARTAYIMVVCACALVILALLLTGCSKEEREAPRFTFEKIQTVKDSPGSGYDFYVVTDTETDRQYLHYNSYHRSGITELLPPVEEEVAEEAADVEFSEDFENEKIEAALLEMGYFRDDIPLDFETQAYLRAACEESGVDFELALAVIHRETNFRNVEGDGGDSIGYMQVQPKWHLERMNRLGVTDLSHPLGNFRVGCDYLRELMNKYGIREALTAYNSGKPGKSDYADAVMKYWTDLKNKEG